MRRGDEDDVEDVSTSVEEAKEEISGYEEPPPGAGRVVHGEAEQQQVSAGVSTGARDDPVDVEFEILNHVMVEVLGRGNFPNYTSDALTMFVRENNVTDIRMILTMDSETFREQNCELDFLTL